MWHVALPVWGKRYIDIFETATWPALQRALFQLNHPYLLHVITDDRDRMDTILYGQPAVYRPVPGSNPTSPDLVSLSLAHQRVIEETPHDHIVVLLTADLVLSLNALVHCSYRFDTGIKAIAINGMRACAETLPEPGMGGAELSEWGWTHRHPLTIESTWPNGTAMIIWRMYFEQGGNVVCRMALPHPLAIVKSSHRLHGFFPTIDVNLLSHFAGHEIHVITDPAEACMLELSPRDYWTGPRTETMQYRFEHGGPSAPSFSRLNVAHQEFFFSHQVIIKGVGGDCGDYPIVNRLLGL